MSCNWLKRRREAIGMKQEVLAREIGLYEEAIRRWENCSKGAKKQVPYAALARVLRTTAAELAADHASDLEQLAEGSAGDDKRFWIEKAAAARRAAEQARREHCFPAVDPMPIERQLAACAGTVLGRELAKAHPSLPDDAGQARHIAELLTEGDLPALFRWANAALEQAIDQAPRAADLLALRQLLLVIAKAAAARQPDLTPGCCEHYDGESAFWPYLALIDASYGRNGMRRLKPHPKEPRWRLDDQPDSTGYAVRSGQVAQASKDGRVRQFVQAIADALAVEAPTPSVDDRAAFTDHCALVNGALAVTNGLDDYVLALWEWQTQEAPEVRDEILTWLPSLITFNAGVPGSNRTPLRVDSATLGSWLAHFLHPIDRRLSQFEAVGPAPTDPFAATNTTRHRPGPQQEYPTLTSSPVNIHAGDNSTVTIASGEGHSVGQATGNGRVVQLDAVPIPEQLATLLDALFDHTAADKAGYKALRGAAREIQGELEDAGTVSEQGRGLLQRAAEALPSTDKAVDLAGKIADLVCRLPGLGA